MDDRNRQLGASTTAPTLAPPCTECRGFNVPALVRGNWQRGTCHACGGAGTAEAQQARSAAEVATVTAADRGRHACDCEGSRECAECHGEGKCMVPRLYPRGYTEVYVDCEACGASGECPQCVTAADPPQPEPEPDYKIRVNGVPWLTMGSPSVVDHMKARAIVTDELAVIRPHAPKQPEPAEAAGEVLPLWECGADGVWSRGPLNATSAWVYETTFAYRSGRALAPMGPARQTLEEAMRDADEAAVRDGHRLPADSMVFRPELADEAQGHPWKWCPGDDIWTYSGYCPVSAAVLRALWDEMPEGQAADALARILRVHGADVREVGP